MKAKVQKEAGVFTELKYSHNHALWGKWLKYSFRVNSQVKDGCCREVAKRKTGYIINKPTEKKIEF